MDVAVFFAGQAGMLFMYYPSRARRELGSAPRLQQAESGGGSNPMGSPVEKTTTTDH